MDNKAIIEREVGRNPGISFTDLKQKTGLSNGVLQYHISCSDRVEKRKGAIVEAGACETCDLSERCKSKCLLKVLRKERNQEILRMKEECSTQLEIGEKLGLDPSTISHHIHKLRSIGLLEKDKVPEEVSDHLKV